MTEVFLDTSFAIALSSVTDQNHVLAVKLANQIETNRTRLVTTQAILLEIGNALSKQRYRAAVLRRWFAASQFSPYAASTSSQNSALVQ